jgi:hypothetical protein
MTEALMPWVVEFEKSNFFEAFAANMPAGGFTGLIASGFVGVLPVPASSSSEKSSFPAVICVDFLGLRGDFCVAALG